MSTKAKLIALVLLFQCSEAFCGFLSGNVPGFPGASFTYEEDESHFKLTLTGGEISSGVDSIFDIGTDWHIHTNFNANDASNTTPPGDFLTFLDTSVEHDIAPHGETPVGGNVCLQFFDCHGDSMIAFFTPVMDIPSLLTGSFKIPHVLPKHYDIYSWNSSFEHTNDQITAWNAIIEGQHVIPAPPTFLLFFIGMLCLFPKFRSFLFIR